MSEEQNRLREIDCANLEIENARLRARVERLEKALNKIAERWFDPTYGIAGTCTADCDAGLPDKNPHVPWCPFQIAKEALAEMKEGK